LSLVLAQSILNLPYLLSSPKYLREDLFGIASGKINGAWYAVDPATADGRPVVHFMYFIIFGKLYGHPLLLHVWLVVVSMILVAALFTLARRFLERPWAFMVVLTWIVLPTHMTLDHWLSASNITLGLLVGILGFIWLEGRLRAGSSAYSDLWQPMAIFLVALALYESLVVLIVPGSLVLAWFLNRNSFSRVAVLSFPLVLLVACVAVLEKGRTIVWAGLVRPMSAAALANRPSTSLALIALAFLGVGVVCAAIALIRQRNKRAALMILIGAMQVIVGVIPFMTNGFEDIFFGLGDRANVMSAIGVALAINGFVRLLFTRETISLAVMVIVSLALIPLHLARSNDWVSTQRNEYEAARFAIQQAPSTGNVVLPLTDRRTDKLGASERVEIGLIIRSGILGHVRTVTFSK
jgi:hypothetical protein